MSRRPLKDKIYLLISTLLGIGYTPVCPGTAAAMAAVPVFILAGNHYLFLIITAVSLILSFPASRRAEEIFQEKDCKKIVIDDFSGMLITFLFIPRQVQFVVTGFFLFRMLDLLKIPPADMIEKKGGAIGVVGDDIAAGIYANLILQIARIFV